MPEHIRALIVILLLTSLVFVFSRRSVTAQVGSDTFKHWRTLWFGLTLTAFLSHSIWLYALISGMLVYFSSSWGSSRIALFFIALFAVPMFSLQVPGFGLINYLIDLNHLRILVLTLFLPTFFDLATRTKSMSFGRSAPDKLIATYLILSVILLLRETSFSDAIRQSFYAFIDVFIPYYVISRSLKDIQEFKIALSAFVFAGLLLAAIGTFEILRHWLLYSAVAAALDPSLGSGQYLGRAGILRSSATAGHSIALGYMLAVSIGLFLFIKPYLTRNINQQVCMAGLAAGLISALSRGPWVGVAALLIIYIATGRYAARRLAILFMAGIMSLPLLAIIPGGNKILDLLPFIGTVDKGNIDYRERLIDNSLIVIKQNPWFGSVNYLETPEMQSLRQGAGTVIDIVNTYIGVALETGLIGLSIFLGFFVAVLLSIFKAMRSLPNKDDELYRLGRSLFATLVGILVIILTVSSITIIPIVYWSVAALGVAYVHMVRNLRPS